MRKGVSWWETPFLLVERREFLWLSWRSRVRWLRSGEASTIDKLYAAVDFGEEGVVAAAAYVLAGFERCSALTDDDGASGDELAAECFDAEALRVGVAAVFELPRPFLCAISRYPSVSLGINPR